MKSFSLFILLLISGIVFSQSTFEKRYGSTDDDKAYSVVETYDGNYVFTGETRSTISNYQIVYTVKIDMDGDTIWTRKEEVDHSRGLSIIETQDSCLLIAGELLINDELSPLLVKYDTDGNTIWVKNYSNFIFSSGAFKIVETYNGNLAFTCTDNGAGSIMGLASNGNYEWKKTYVAENRKCIGLSVTDDNGIVTSGSLDTEPSYTNSWILKFNEDLSPGWEEAYGGEDTRSGAYDITKSKHGGYISCGSWFDGNVILHGQIYMIKMDSEGNMEWEQMISGSSSEDDLRGVGVAVADDGYIACGNYQENAGDNDIYLVKLDTLGDTEWTQSFGGSAEDKSTSIIITSDGGYLISGYTYNNTMGGSDAYIIKTDELGQIINTSQVAKEEEIQIFPNPFNNSFRIESQEGINEIIIQNLDNKIIEHIKVSNANISEIDLSAHASGIYLLSIIYDDRIVQKKVLKI